MNKELEQINVLVPIIYLNSKIATDMGNVYNNQFAIMRVNKIFVPHDKSWHRNYGRISKDKVFNLGEPWESSYIKDGKAKYLLNARPLAGEINTIRNQIALGNYEAIKINYMPRDRRLENEYEKLELQPSQYHWAENIYHMGNKLGWLYLENLYGENVNTHAMISVFAEPVDIMKRYKDKY